MVQLHRKLSEYPDTASISSIRPSQSKNKPFREVHWQLRDFARFREITMALNIVNILINLTNVERYFIFPLW